MLNIVPDANNKAVFAQYAIDYNLEDDLALVEVFLDAIDGTPTNLDTRSPAWLVSNVTTTVTNETTQKKLTLNFVIPITSLVVPRTYKIGITVTDGVNPDVTGFFNLITQTPA